MAATASSPLSRLKSLFTLLVLLPRAASAAMQMQEQEGKRVPAGSPWHPLEIVLRDLFLSGGDHEYNKSPTVKEDRKGVAAEQAEKADQEQEPLGAFAGEEASFDNEDLLKLLMRADAVDAEALEAKIDLLFMQGIAPKELQLATISALHEEQKSIAKAISIVEGRKEEGDLNKKAVLNNLKKRREAADRKLQAITNRTMQALHNIDAFLEFVTKQKELQQTRKNKNKNKNKVQKVEITFNILQRKKKLLQQYLEKLEPKNTK